MADEAEYEQPGGTQPMGGLVWGPPGFVVTRARAAKRKGLREALQWMVLGLIAVVGLVAFPGNPTLQAALGLAAAALFVWFGLSWLRALDMERVWFCVLERGVLMPSSFSKGVGFSKLGPACIIPIEDATGFEDLRKPEGRAVIVWAAVGTGGMVSNRIDAVELSPEEQDKILDGFVEGLRKIGIKERRAGEEDQD